MFTHYQRERQKAESERGKNARFREKPQLVPEDRYPYAEREPEDRYPYIGVPASVEREEEDELAAAGVGRDERRGWCVTAAPLGYEQVSSNIKHTNTSVCGLKLLVHAALSY